MLIAHLSHIAEESADSDLVSGMLTAIRDFARDSFGRGKEGELNEIRLESAARGGQVLISKNAYSRVANLVDAEPLGRIQIKGRDGAVEIYEVRGLK